MPMYEYACGKCGARFEAIQKFSDPPLVSHDSCGGPVERLLSAPALQFKGSGWYITDYARSASGAKKEANGSSSATESKTETSPAKTEAKSDAKS
jgi:putative FmdB family regulatory protein